MENKIIEEKPSKKNTIYTIIIVALSLVLVALVGYIITDKDKNDDKPTPTPTPVVSPDVTDEPTVTPTPEVPETPTPTATPDVLTEAEAKKVYQDIVNYGSTNQIYSRSLGDGLSYDYFTTLYNKEKNIIDTVFSYDAKMTIAYKKLENEQKITKIYDDTTYSTVATVKTSDLKDAYKFYFGIEPEFQNFESYVAGKCTFVDEVYTCIIPAGGGLSGPMSLITTFDSYKYENGILYVYEKAIYYDGTDFSKEKYGQIIPELTGKAKTILTDNNYSSYFMKYLHTFKKTPDGNFYFYSTEFVE